MFTGEWKPVSCFSHDIWHTHFMRHITYIQTYTFHTTYTYMPETFARVYSYITHYLCILHMTYIHTQVTYHIYTQITHHRFTLHVTYVYILHITYA